MDTPPCEVCGAPAVIAVLDTYVSEPPVADEQERLWTNCSGKRGFRVRCAAHPYHTKYEVSEAYKAWADEDHRKWREKVGLTGSVT